MYSIDIIIAINICTYIELYVYSQKCHIHMWMRSQYTCMYINVNAYIHMCDILNVSAHKKNFLLQEPGPAVVQPAPVAVPQPEPQSTWSLKSRFQHDFHPKKLGKVNPF